MAKVGRYLRNLLIVYLGWQAVVGIGYAIYSAATGDYTDLGIGLISAVITGVLCWKIAQWAGYRWGKRLPQR